MVTTHLILTPQQVREIVKKNEEKEKEKDKCQVSEVVTENKERAEKIEEEKTESVRLPVRQKEEGD